MARDAIFYFDFNSPYAYLAAERIDDLIPGVEWRPIAFPILLNELGRLEDAMRRDPAPIVAEVGGRLAERGLPALKPPDAWPLHAWSLFPLRAAVFAVDQDRGPEFSRAAFREMFVHGRSLVEPGGPVRDAARAAGLDPDEVERGAVSAEIKDRLKANTEEAHARGVAGIPTVAVGDELFWGDDHLDEAAAAAA